MDEYFNKAAYFEGKTSGYKLGYRLYNSRIRWIPPMKELMRFKSSGNVLDVGCAYGFFLKFLPSSFSKHGIEISRSAAMHAQANNPASRIIAGDFLKAKFAKNFFDVVTAFEVLEHLPRLGSTIDKIHALLKKDGYLIASFPIVESSLERKWFTQFDETHINPSDRVISEIERKFEILDKKFTFDCFSFIVISSFRIAPVHQSYFIIAKKK